MWIWRFSIGNLCVINLDFHLKLPIESAGRNDTQLKLVKLECCITTKFAKECGVFSKSYFLSYVIGERLMINILKSQFRFLSFLFKFEKCLDDLSLILDEKIRRNEFKAWTL